MKTTLSLGLILVLGLAGAEMRAQDEPRLVPDVVDYQKLIPILPEAPAGWIADKPEGSTEDVGGFRITNVHRDYRKGEGEKVPTVAISILDSVSNPDYVTATTASWNHKTETLEGYSKPVTIDGHPGFEAYDKERRNASLWVMIETRYFVQIEVQDLDPKDLQEWIKRIDLKQLAAIK